MHFIPKRSTSALNFTHAHTQTNEHTRVHTHTHTHMGFIICTVLANTLVGDHMRNWISLIISSDWFLPCDSLCVCSCFSLQVQMCYLFLILVCWSNMHLPASSPFHNSWKRWKKLNITFTKNFVYEESSLRGSDTVVGRCFEICTSLTVTRLLEGGIFSFLGTFAKLWKVTIRFVISICLSVGLYVFHLHGRNWLPLEGFWWNLIFDFFCKVCRENSMISGSLSPRHGASSGCGWRVAANILNKQSRTANKGWSSSLGVGRGANNSSP
jgi:hypothetical protein